MKKPLLLIFVSFGCLNFYGQDTPASVPLPNPNKISVRKESTKACTTEAAQMPLLKGVRIGMAYDEVKEVYPEIETNDWFQQKYRINQGGLFMVPAKEVSNADFRQDLRKLSLNIENDKLNVFEFIYKSKKWGSAEEMISDISQIFGVDPEYWANSNEEAFQLSCAGFTVYANHLSSTGKKMISLVVHKK